VDRVQCHRSRVLPPLPENSLDVGHSRTSYGQLHVVPGRPDSVHLSHLLALRIAEVALVVAPAVAQVDAADIGDVEFRLIAVAYHHQLLVV
jgi:hypothetical protein